MLTLDHGVLATITVGRLPAGSTPGSGIYAVRVHGSHGSAFVDEDRPEVRVYQPNSTGTGVHTHYGYGAASALAVRGLVNDFVDAIDDGRPPLCGVRDGRELAAVLEASYASAASGQIASVSRIAGREDFVQRVASQQARRS